MRLRTTLAYIGLVGAGMLMAGGPAHAYDPVTDARLTNPEPQNWLMTRGNYQGWSYSPLDQINTSNVKNLTPVWTMSTGVNSGHQAPAIVNDGVMFVSTPSNQVIAVEAATGTELWRYKRTVPEGFAPLHNTNRGVALHGDKVYFAALDAVLVALDATTGKVAWEAKVEDWKSGYYMTVAPLVVDGNVLVGVSGGEFGIRGFVAAFDGETGKPAWKTYTIPSPDQPGGDSWKKPDASLPQDPWKTGGGGTWMTGTFDPKSDTVYWGVGNPSPWFGDQRPGDNLYTASTIAMDGKSGQIKGHFQYNWNDSWDWDEMNAPMIMDFQKDGQTVPGLFHAARNGYLYWLQRKANDIQFISAEPYVKQNVYKSIDPETGRADVDMEHKPGTGKEAAFCPSLWGGKDWPFDAYNPKTGMVYIPSNDNHCGHLNGKVEPRVAGQWWTGVSIPNIGFTIDKDAAFYGEVQAFNLNNGKREWRQTFANSFNFGSLLTTAGNVVFGGGTNDRDFRAYDARSGEQLWSFKTNSGIIAPPSSFAVDGVQYVAVTSGWGVDAAAVEGLMSNLKGWPKAVPEGGVIWVFAVGK